MIEYGEPIKKDITDIKIQFYSTSISDDPIMIKEHQLDEFIDLLNVGDKIHIIIYDGYGYDILSFLAVIASNIDKKILTEKVKEAIAHWKKNQ